MSELFTLVPSYVTAAAAALGALAAWRGLVTRRPQLLGQTDHELARRLSRGVRIVRDASHAVRSWATVGDVKEFYRITLAKFDETVAELDGALVEAKAVWCDEVDSLRSQLRRFARSLHAAVYTDLRATEGEDCAAYEDLQRCERRLWWPPAVGDDETDELTSILDPLMVGIDERAAPLLRRRIGSRRLRGYGGKDS